MKIICRLLRQAGFGPIGDREKGFSWTPTGATSAIRLDVGFRGACYGPLVLSLLVHWPPEHNEEGLSMYMFSIPCCAEGGYEHIVVTYRVRGGRMPGGRCYAIVGRLPSKGCLPAGRHYFQSP